MIALLMAEHRSMLAKVEDANGKLKLSAYPVASKENKIIACITKFTLTIPEWFTKKRPYKTLISKKPVGKINEYKAWLISNEDAIYIAKRILRPPNKKFEVLIQEISSNKIK